MLTIQDLRELVDRFVPAASRHPTYDPAIAWWPSHELGHLLIAAPIEIGSPLYGLVYNSTAACAFGPGHEQYTYCCEHAAMYVSGALLRAARIVEASRAEHEHLRGVSPQTSAWGDLPENVTKVRALLRHRHCETVPAAREGLVKRLASRIAT